MRTPTILLALALAGTAMAATVPELPTCTIPDASALCVRLVVGPIVVGNGDEEEFNNDTYVIEGSVTVEDGGRVEIILSSVVFADESPIVVQSGGELIIEFSDLAASGAVILAEDGAHVEVRASNFTGTTLRIETDDFTSDENTFTGGNPAVHLVGFDGTFGDSLTRFVENTVGLNVTGGAPTIGPLQHSNDQLGIALFQTSANLDAIEMFDVLDGILAVNSQGTYSNMAIDDNVLPPDVGIEIVSASGTTVVRDNTLSEWGIAIRCVGSPGVQLIDNVFFGNLRDVEGC